MNFMTGYLRLKAEGTADFLVGIFENLWNANEFLDNWQKKISIFLFKSQREEKSQGTLDQSA